MAFRLSGRVLSKLYLLFFVIIALLFKSHLVDAKMGVSPSKTFGPEAAKIVSKVVSNVDLSGDGAAYASPSPTSGLSTSDLTNQEEIVVGAGCFWGIELAFQRVPGVLKTQVGYAQGAKKNPTYEEVCSGSTGHSEVVQIIFDSTKITLDELLIVFWDIHDPTTLNRQGNDVGTQYRSGIYYTKPEQKDIIVRSRDYKQQYLHNFGAKEDIVTEIEPLNKFWPAEGYHQRYLEKGGQCSRKGDLSPIRCYG